MFRLKKYLIAPALFTGLAVAAVGFAQPPEGRPPEGKGDKGDRRPPPRDRKGPPAGELRTERRDPAVEAWARTLIEKMNDPHDTVRESARVGLAAMGRQVLPLLRPIADGEDGARATAANKVIDRIEGSDRLGRRAGPGGPPQGGPTRREGPDGRPGPPERGAPGREGPVGGERPPQPPGGERPPQPPGGERRPMAIEAALAELDLTEKQKDQLRGMKDEFQKNMRETFEKIREGKLERPEAGEAMRANHEAFLKEVKEVLSDEQFKRFKDLLPRPPAPGDRPGRPGRPPQPE